MMPLKTDKLTFQKQHETNYTTATKKSWLGF